MWNFVLGSSMEIKTRMNQAKVLSGEKSFISGKENTENQEKKDSTRKQSHVLDLPKDKGRDSSALRTNIKKHSQKLTSN